MAVWRAAARNTANSSVESLHRSSRSSLARRSDEKSVGFRTSFKVRAPGSVVPGSSKCASQVSNSAPYRRAVNRQWLAETPASVFRSGPPSPFHPDRVAPDERPGTAVASLLAPLGSPRAARTWHRHDRHLPWGMETNPGLPHLAAATTKMRSESVARQL
jgi:hypothetical protein